MTSHKQIQANQANAQLSTGPITLHGKTMVAANAIRHGIFTKDLIIASGAGQESLIEYEELLENLVICLSPRNQIENLIVEKIAVDFWRLRRTIRFEAGSITKQIEEMLRSRYSYELKDNAGLDREIRYVKEKIEWNSAYLKCLERRQVTFDKPMWKGEELESDILDDFYRIARSFPDLTKSERSLISEGMLAFADASRLLLKHGFSTSEEISTRLIEIYSMENERLENEIETLENKKIANSEEDRRNSLMGSVPSEENVDKALKYERSIQKSIFQNLIMLKKLQGSF